MGNGVVLHSYPWYPSDWLKSETRMKLPLAGRSIYRDLLDRCWLDGSLPPEESQLAYIGGSTLSQFKKAWPLMIGKFFLAEDGRLHNQKVDDKRAELIEANERRRAAGRTGGQASAEVRRQPTVQAIVQAIVQPTVKQSSSNREAIVKQSSSHPYPPPLPLPENALPSAAAFPRDAHETREDSPPPLPKKIIAGQPDLETFRELLQSAMAEGTDPPDDSLVGQVIAAANGASADDLADRLRQFAKRNTRPPKSYGFWPDVVGAWYATPKRKVRGTL